MRGDQCTRGLVGNEEGAKWLTGLWLRQKMDPD
jgi:hypothetical protein